MRDMVDKGWDRLGVDVGDISPLVDGGCRMEG